MSQRNDLFIRSGLYYEPSSLISISLPLRSIYLLFFLFFVFHKFIFWVNSRSILYGVSPESTFALVRWSLYWVSFIFYSGVWRSSFSFWSGYHCWSVNQSQTDCSLRANSRGSWIRYSIRFKWTSSFPFSLLLLSLPYSIRFKYLFN